MVKFLVDDKDALVDTIAREFDVNAPIYVGGTPRGFQSPIGVLVSYGSAWRVFVAVCVELLTSESSVFKWW